MTNDLTVGDLLKMYKKEETDGVKKEIRYRGGIKEKEAMDYCNEPVRDITGGKSFESFNRGCSDHLIFGVTRYGIPIRKSVLFIDRNSSIR